MTVVQMTAASGMAALMTAVNQDLIGSNKITRSQGFKVAKELPMGQFNSVRRQKFDLIILSQCTMLQPKIIKVIAHLKS